MQNGCRSLRTAGFLLAVMVLLALAPTAWARAAAGDRELLELELERTDAVLEQVREVVAESNNPRLKELFGEALRVQRHAKDIFLREGAEISGPDKLRVLQLTRQARDLALRIQREVREDVTREERTRRLLERSRVMLERLEEHAAEVQEPRFRAALDEARRQLLLAEQHYTDGNFDVALRLAESAHDLLRNMTQGARRHLAPERVESELRRTEQLLERARETVGPDDGSAQQLLQRAEQTQRRARDAFHRGQPARALELSGQARQILRQILDQVADAVGEEDVQRARERFDARLERLREEAGGELPEEARPLVDQALEARGRAMEAQAAGEYAAALTHLRIGLDLLHRASRLGRTPPR